MIAVLMCGSLVEAQEHKTMSDDELSTLFNKKGKTPEEMGPILTEIRYRPFRKIVWFMKLTCPLWLYHVDG